MNKMAWLYAWVLVLSGLAIATTLTLEWSPELENPIVEIQAYWSAASPTAMAAVGSRLEASMLGLGSVRDISSRSSRGSWSARVSLDPSSEMALQQAMISDRLTAIRDSLPPGLTFSLEPVAVDRLDSKVLMTLQLAVDKVADGQSKERVELIASRLRSIRGIADVKVRGLRTPELRASLKDDRAASCDDCASVVRSLLRSALQPRIFGAFRPERHQQLALRRAIDRSSELRRLGLPAQNPMAPERLSDLADLRWNDAPAKSLSRVDGRAMVTLVIVRAPGSDLLNVANRVHRTLEDWGEGETNGLEIHVADDRSERIREELRELASIGGSGFLLIFLVLWIMLRPWRAAALSLFSVLVSLSAAFIFFKPLGLTLNVLTLAGLTLLVGLLVDNVVVVVETLQGLRKGNSGVLCQEPALGIVARRLTLPLAGATISTCVALIPMVYLSGELRELFGAFAVLSAIVLTISLLVSLVLAPLLSRGVGLETGFEIPGISALRKATLAPYRGVIQRPGLSLLVMLIAVGLPFSQLPDRWQEPSRWEESNRREEPGMTPFSSIWPQLAEKYNRLSDRLDWPRLRARLSPVLGGITDRFFRDVEMGEGWELPERPEIRVWLRVPAGSELSKLDELMRPFEQRANESPAVKRTLIQISRREARMTVLFEEEALDSEAPLRLREEMIGQAAGLAGVDISVSGLAPTGFHSGLGRVSGHTVLAIGPNYENLDLLVKNFAARLSRRPRVAGVDVEAGPDDAAAAREVVRIAWGAEASARTGISTAQLAQTLQAGLWRQTPDFHAQVDGIARVPIRVVHEKIEGQDLERLTQRPLVVEGGKVIRLDEHSEISLSKDPPTIERINQRYRRTLRVYYRGDYESGEEMLGQEIEAEPLAPGYVLERPSPGAFQDLASSRKWGVLLGAIALVFLTVAAALESWRRAAVVVLTVPFAWIGVAAAFLLTAQNFTEGAFLGLVLVVGIGVNDSILLVDTFHRLRRRKGRLPAKKSALLALRQRLRPMWLTTLTSIAGMVPILVSANGVHFWQGLATTVIGGLLASTVLGPAVTLALLGLGQKGTDSGPGLG